MNKLKVYKFIVNRKKKVTPSLDTGCRVGGVTVWWYQSKGLGGSRIEYMIEKHVFSNVLV